MKNKKTIVDIPFGKTKEQHNKYYARWRELNREDYNKNRLEWARKYKEKRVYQSRKSHLKLKFGISQEIYEDYFKKQNGICAICEQEPKTTQDKKNRKNIHLYIDHCHKTKKIRGLLCRNCNTGLGFFKDSINLLQNAINYLDDKALNVDDI